MGLLLLHWKHIIRHRRCYRATNRWQLITCHTRLNQRGLLLSTHPFKLRDESCFLYLHNSYTYLHLFIYVSLCLDDRSTIVQMQLISILLFSIQFAQLLHLNHYFLPFIIFCCILLPITLFN